jgi:chemotaxis protein MotB
MSRKPVLTRRLRRHEEHTNHESWAIPYGDLVTLLLAFFVVMYAISSVNAGKYRVLSDSLFAAFRGTPRTMDPIQVGEKQSGSGSELESAVVQSALQGQQRSSLAPVPVEGGNLNNGASPAATNLPAKALAPGVSGARAAGAAAAALTRVADEVARALDDLVKQDLVVMRRSEFWIEVEIKTDLLFPSGSAQLAPYAIDVIQRLGGALAPYPNPIRVEGHTDNKPIKTVAFYSNWELSAARAGSVVRVLQSRGVNPERLAVIGYGEQRPVQSNDTEQGRNANRRVVVVILSTELQRKSDPADQSGVASPIAPSTTTPAAPAGVGSATTAAVVPEGTTASAVGATASVSSTAARTAAPVSATTTSGARVPTGGTAAIAAPAPIGAPLAAPGEPAAMPTATAAPSAPTARAVSPLTTALAPAPANVTLSTSGAHAAGNGIVPAP